MGIINLSKYELSAFIRRIGLIRAADKLRFYFEYIRTYNIRKSFIDQHPNILLPPAYYLYETFNLNYSAYYYNGMKTANWIAEHFKKYKNLENANILDWGCGPGRVIRHLPVYVDKSAHFFGTDYNKNYVTWCAKSIPDISFQKNELIPPLLYTDDFFDCIYGISILTHISESLHFLWFKELMRVLKPGGILFLTLHGDSFKEKLTLEERKKYDDGHIIIKSNTKEGHRTYGAFHPDKFVKELIDRHTLLEHIKGTIINGIPQQDVWIIEKNNFT